jgi:hypothetical protein
MRLDVVERAERHTDLGADRGDTGRQAATLSAWCPWGWDVEFLLSLQSDQPSENSVVM